MVTVTVSNQPNKLPEVREFYYSHNAISWLLLSGFLPVGDEESLYRNPFTGALALIKIRR